MLHTILRFGSKMKSISLAAIRFWDEWQNRMAHTSERTTTFEWQKFAIQSAALKYHIKLVRWRQGSAVTMDYRTSRVRVYLDKENRVQAVPRIG